MSDGQYYYDEFSSMPEPNPEHWTEYGSFLDDEAPLSAIAFDNFYELLWCGNHNGRLTSFLNDGDSGFQKYSSFVAHASTIVEILDLPKHVCSISESCIRLHTRGGLVVHSFEPSLTDFETDDPLTMTCGTIFEPSGGLMHGVEQNYLFVGSSGSPAHVFDLNASEVPVASFDVVSPTACAHSSITFLTLGSGDGKIRLLDPSLRSNLVQHTLDAHSGGVSSVSVQWDGMTMISCGFVGRAINPFDPTSPKTFHADPLVKVFDMRMLRQRAPLTLAIPPPNIVKLLPGGSLLATSTNGYLQTITLDANHEPVLSSLQMMYATLATDPQDAANLHGLADSLTVAATSSSGQFIVSGSAMGAVSLHSRAEASGEDGVVTLSINEASQGLSLPPERPPRPPISPPIDTPNIATTFVLSKQSSPLYETREMPSGFTSTPRLLNSQLKLKPMQKIMPGLLKEAVFQDYIGSIKNTQNFLPNSMLSRKVRDLAYIPCDPRLSENGPGHSHSASATHHFSLHGRSAVPGLRSYSVGSASSNDSDPQAKWATGGKSPNDISSIAPPPAYQKVRSHRGKHRMQMFNYSAFNGTPFVGLENSTPHCWVNPILQVLFAIPSIRSGALATQLSPYHHKKTNTLFGEIGFLFDMMLSIGDASQTRPDVHRVATASNFHRALKSSAEAVAMGLFDSAKSSSSPSSGTEVADPSKESTSISDGGGQLSAKALQNVVQAFCRFLLHQLSTEHIQEVRSQSADSDTAAGRTTDPIDNTFSFEADTSTLFLQSRSTSQDAAHKALTLELSYATQPGPTPPSFSEVLYCSFTKTTSMRGWCTASEAYEPFQQTRRLRPGSIHDVFTILCGDIFANVSNSPSRSGAKAWPAESLWHSRNERGGPWLPVHVEVMFIPSDGESKREGTMYVSEKLVSSPAGLTPPDGSGVLGAVAEAEESSLELVEADGSALGDSQEVWIIYDGRTRTTAGGPASTVHLPKCSKATAAAAVITPLKLFAVVSGIRAEAEARDSPTSPTTGDSTERTSSCHAVLHMCTGRSTQCTSTKGSRSSSIDTDAAYEAAALVDKIIDRVTTCDQAEFLAQDEWTLFNDFAVTKSCEHDVTHFPKWRFPSVILFTRSDQPSLWPEYSLVESLRATQRVAVPASVLRLPSLSSVPCVRPSVDFVQQLQQPDPADGSRDMPDGCLIAFDAEFVSVEVENVVMDSTGQRIVHDEGRQVVGRVSLLDGRRKEGVKDSSCQNGREEQTLLLDDYVLPTEPVVDYVTRFSGLVEEDLNPATSRHAVVSDRTAYLKLRYYRDSGCIFVGHGLQKDFETANIFVPPEQIRDTVELWRLPNMRKISLRFLASYLLHMEIQDDIHDSIEDARTALILYRHYEDTLSAGETRLQSTLAELYAFGSRTNWTIGLDRINVSPTAVPRKHLVQHQHQHPPEVSHFFPSSHPHPQPASEHMQSYIPPPQQQHHDYYPSHMLQLRDTSSVTGGRGSGEYMGTGVGRGGRGRGGRIVNHRPDVQFRNQYF